MPGVAYDLDSQISVLVEYDAHNIINPALRSCSHYTRTGNCLRKAGWSKKLRWVTRNNLVHSSLSLLTNTLLLYNIVHSS